MQLLLEALPGWDQNSRQLQLDQLWNSHLRAFQDFVDTRGQMPRYKNYSSEFEHRLVFDCTTSTSVDLRGTWWFGGLKL